MKKNIFFLIAISTGLSLHGGVLYLRNLYKKPIQIKINGQVIQGALIKTEETARLIDINNLQSLAIKTQESLQFKNLDKELQLARSCPEEKNILLTIPPTDNILYWKPGIVECKDKINQQVIGQDPTQAFFNKQITEQEMLQKLSAEPYPYGLECAKKIRFICNKGQSTCNQLATRIHARRLLQKNVTNLKSLIIKEIDDMYQEISRSQASAPSTSTKSSANLVMTKQLIDRSLKREDFLEMLVKPPYPYGTDYKDKVNIIINASSKAHYFGDIKNNPLDLLKYFLEYKIAGTDVTTEQAETAIKRMINDLVNLKIPSLKNMGYIK